MLCQFALWISDPQAAIGVPAQPAVAGVDNHPCIAQALEPGAQQGRGLHVAGEHPARGADEGFDAQAMNPLAQGVRVEVAQQGVDRVAALGIAADEGRVGLGMGDVHAAHARQQELAAHRRHGVEHLHRHTALGQRLGGHQAGGAATDHGD